MNRQQLIDKLKVCQSVFDQIVSKISTVYETENEFNFTLKSTEEKIELLSEIRKSILDEMGAEFVCVKCMAKSHKFLFEIISYGKSKKVLCWNCREKLEKAQITVKKNRKKSLMICPNIGIIWNGSC